jgi:hypothetical protein
MTAKSKKIPTPDEVLAEVLGKQPEKTYPFEDYLPAVHQMQNKGFSYAKIADFLGERLEMKISRGQIYRAYQTWLINRSDEPDEREPDMPEDRDEYEEMLAEAVRELRQKAEERFQAPHYPENFGDDVICAAADRIRAVHEQQQADERAAEEADKLKEKSNVTGS